MIAVVGTSITLFGILLLVLPGPAFVVIPTGLAVLSLEFAWARRWLRRIRDEAAKQANGLKGLNGKRRDS